MMDTGIPHCLGTVQLIFDATIRNRLQIILNLHSDLSKSPFIYPLQATKLSIITIKVIQYCTYFTLLIQHRPQAIHTTTETRGSTSTHICNYFKTASPTFFYVLTAFCTVHSTEPQMDLCHIKNTVISSQSLYSNEMNNLKQFYCAQLTTLNTYKKSNLYQFYIYRHNKNNKDYSQINTNYLFSSLITNDETEHMGTENI